MKHSNLHTNWKSGQLNTGSCLQSFAFHLWLRNANVACGGSTVTLIGDPLGICLIIEIY